MNTCKMPSISKPIDVLDVLNFVGQSYPRPFRTHTSSSLLGPSESHNLFRAFPNLAVLTCVGRPVKLVMIALLLSTLSFSLHSSPQVLHPCVFRCCALLPSQILYCISLPFIKVFWIQFLNLFCRYVNFANLNCRMYDYTQCKSFNQLLHHDNVHLYAGMLSNHAWIKVGCFFLSLRAAKPWSSSNHAAIENFWQHKSAKGFQCIAYNCSGTPLIP